MEEYIRPKEEKSQKRRKAFNWETTKYGRIWYDEDVHDLRSVENKFPAIAFNDSLTSGETLSREPTKMDTDNDNEKVNMPLLLSPEPTLGEARRRISWRHLIVALGLHIREEMESLGVARDPMLRLCHRMMAHSIAEERLWGLTVIMRELLVIDMVELVRLQIYMDIDNTWAWVALGLERQPDVAAGTPGAAEDAPIVDQGDQAVLAPVQAPTPPPVASRTMP
nr:hypothetical protein [Tanacetum cinerariifolium]